MANVGAAAGLSESWVSRIERGLVTDVPLVVLARMCALVGLDLSARTFPGPHALRDRGHRALLERLREALHPSLLWRTEVPFPRPGDQRAWDATITAPPNAWRYAVEAETNPTDGQALIRRLNLKRRDGGMDGVILLLPDSRIARTFRREFGALLVADFPVPGARAVELLAAAADPGGSSVVVR